MRDNKYINKDVTDLELKEIIYQLEMCRFECEAGPLEMNEAFIALKEMDNRMSNRMAM
jgi:hypothetical protein